MYILDKIQKLPKGVKASGALFIASIVTKGIAYITTPFYTRLLSAEEFGQVSVFLTWQNILGIFAMFCLMNGVFNNGMVDYPNERDSYSFSILILSNFITIVFLIVLTFCYSFFKTKVHIQLYQIILMALTFLFKPAYDFWAARQRYELKYKATVIWSVILSLASPIFAIIAISVFQDEKVRARLIAGQGVMIVIYSLFYIYLATKNKFRVDFRFWKAAFLFNLPLIPHYLSALLLNSSDRIMISMMVSDSAAAYYSVAASVASVVFIVWEAINSSLVPFTYECCKKGDYKSISKVTSLLLVLFGLACILLMLISPELVKIMATKEYAEAIYIIPPLVGGVFFQALYYVAANIIYYYKKPKYVMIASLTATILNLILNYVFIYWFGYAVAAYTTLVCYAIQASIDFMALKKVTGTFVYNMKHICWLSLSIIAASIVGGVLCRTTIIRYLIIVAFLIIIVFNKNKMFTILRKLQKEISW